MVTLTAQKREGGKAHVARKAGMLPAVVYGRKEESMSIAVPLREFKIAFAKAGESGIIELSGLGVTKDVLINDVSYDAVSGVPLHADFYAIEQGQVVEVSIPIEFEGISPAVKEQGGILVKVMHELEVEGQPKNLPHSFIVDISKLGNLDDQIHVRDLVLPSGVTTNVDADEVVAMIDVAKDEPVEVVPMDISQIETSVEKGKKEEEATAEGVET